MARVLIYRNIVTEIQEFTRKYCISIYTVNELMN